MAGSTIGNIVKLTTFGESHGPCIGAVLDGIPAGMALSEDDIQPYLDRRRPGKSNITTARKEEDKVRIVSGIFEGLTTGTPIALLIENNDQHSSDYAEMQSMYRPGHADFTYDAKYGFRDYRGGGRSSGRETAARVAAGAIAEVFLKKELGIDFCFYTAAIGDVVISRKNFDRNEILRSATAMPDDQANARAVALIEEMKSSLDSVGGMIEGRITGSATACSAPTGQAHRIMMFTRWTGTAAQSKSPTMAAASTAVFPTEMKSWSVPILNRPRQSRRRSRRLEETVL